jgi:hypothetical protein
MKSVTIKENNFSLYTSENYKKELDYEISVITQKYSELIVDYLKFAIENLKNKKDKLLKFIIIRGLDTITHVFLFILYFTKNMELTYFHSQKSYYFYVEFVGQISDDEKMFLQLTSRDASMYVYKKTVFDINNEYKTKDENTSKEFKDQMGIIKSYINLYQMYLFKIIKSDTIDILFLNNIPLISEKINKLQNKTHVFILEDVIDKIYNKINNTALFFEINHSLIKKFLKHPESIKIVDSKLVSKEFKEKLDEPQDKFIKWLIS